MTRKSWEKWEDELVKKYFVLYNKNILINHLNRSWGSISQRASKSLKLPERHKSANYSNITFFDVWSNEMAYILGLLAADGCIHLIDKNKSKSNYAISLSLETTDKKLVKDVRDLLAPNKKIYDEVLERKGKKYYTSTLKIGSTYMCNRLISLGVTQRKSKTIDFPDVPEKYVNHFVRGFFDGDGSIGTYGRYKENRVNFVSASKQVLEKTNVNIDRCCDIGIKNIYYGKASKTYQLNYHCKEALKVCDWMYQDSTIHLDRKYKKYREAAG